MSIESERDVVCGIFTERLKAENGKWEAEIEWREKRDVSWASRAAMEERREEEERERERG